MMYRFIVVTANARGEAWYPTVKEAWESKKPGEAVYVELVSTRTRCRVVAP